MMPGPVDSLEIASTAMIRSHFPALTRRLGENAVAYFDGPGGTQVPRSVVEAMTDYLYHHNANTHWSFATSQETDEALSLARQTFADFFNASPREVAFGSNMTTLTFHLARALGRGLKPGDEVVVTELDHHANIDPWRDMAQERGLTLRVVRMIPETGQLDIEDLDQKINRRTRLLAIGAASNALGTISDVAYAAKIAHDAGALVFVDAVHYAPHILVDVKALDCDFLACSAYKFYGPHIGIVYGKLGLLRSLDAPKLEPSPDTAPERIETGTQNHEGIVGAASAVDFLASLAPEGATRRERTYAVMEGLHQRGITLITHLWRELSGIKRDRLHGPSPEQPRTPTVSFSLEGMSSVKVAIQLAKHGIFVSNGDFYATTVIERLGRSEEGLVRVGCACYTTADEIDRLIEEVRKLALV